MGDDESEQHVREDQRPAGYTAADEFRDLLPTGEPAAYEDGGMLYSTSEAFMEQLGELESVPEAQADLACYSTADAYLEEFGLEASEEVEVEPLSNYSPTEEFLERLASAPSDRRGAARIIRVLAAGMVDPQSTPIVVIDLSLTGLRIGCVEPLELHSAIRLDLPLGPQPLRVLGRVCWCKEHASGNYEAGLRLAPLNAEQIAAYRAFLEGTP